MPKSTRNCPRNSNKLRLPPKLCQKIPNCAYKFWDTILSGDPIKDPCRRLHVTSITATGLNCKWFAPKPKIAYFDIKNTVSEIINIRSNDNYDNVVLQKPLPSTKQAQPRPVQHSLLTTLHKQPVYNFTSSIFTCTCRY